MFCERQQCTATDTNTHDHTPDLATSLLHSSTGRIAQLYGRVNGVVEPKSRANSYSAVCGSIAHRGRASAYSYI